MASRKLQVLDFAKAYFVRWGRSPSYGEIANGLSVSRDTVKKHVATLTREGVIRREAGDRRGMTFPELEGRVSIDEAARVLSLAGWKVNTSEQAISITPALTFPPLPRVPELGHTPVSEFGGNHVGQQSSAGQGHAGDHRSRTQEGAG